ncbi:MAG TPA: hypothetical protein VH110_02020 [Candidatus Acidoferrum sp.]|jgi:hypothetical protein|nr:hypothetical protein [Candidatus Acidoferrum sp.]
MTEDKAQAFYNHVRQLESSYAMFSVSLNESMELRQQGILGKAAQNMEISSGLCGHLTRPLTCLLRALGEHAKHYGTMPSAAPLDPANFMGPKGQRSARMSALVSRVLLSHRQQFLYKANTLCEMVEDLSKDYCQAADDLAEYRAANPRSAWDSLDANHFDLNTCLRETIVLLKSFLMALPEDQLGAFQNTVREQSETRETERPVRSFVFRHRRMSQIAGQ